LILIFFKGQKGTYPKNAAFSLEGIGSQGIIIAVACLFFVVCLRSYVGLTLDFSWKSLGFWGTALICAVVFGKTIGGFIADRFGIIKTSLISLGIAAPLFLFPQIPLAGVTALFLFNMTMPITLWAMAKIMPGAKGFAFGLLTFGLFLGFLPTYLGISIPADIYWQFALLAAISLALLLLGLRQLPKRAEP
jgi:FSR family fosmidomycin resistance protein-like MFS transporter